MRFCCMHITNHPSLFIVIFCLFIHYLLLFTDNTMNLHEFIDMDPNFGEGQVKDLDSFLTMFMA